jgi:hypothetical protein
VPRNSSVNAAEFSALSRWVVIIDPPRQLKRRDIYDKSYITVK